MVAVIKNILQGILAGNVPSQTHLQCWEAELFCMAGSGLNSRPGVSGIWLQTAIVPVEFILLCKAYKK